MMFVKQRLASPSSEKNLDQGLSKHQEVGFTPMTKVTKLILVFWYNKKVNPEK